MRRFFVVCIVLLVGLAAVPAMAQKQKADSGRTLIEAQNNLTPETAVRSFLDAFADSDYFAVYFMLSPRAKQEFSNLYGAFSLPIMFPGLGIGQEMPGSFLDPSVDVADDISLDTFSNTALVFDNLVYAAERTGLLPIQLGQTTLGAPQVDEGIISYPVENVGGTPAEFTVEVMILSDGRWRVDRIAWDGSEPEIRPWGVDTSK